MFPWRRSWILVALALLAHGGRALGAPVPTAGYATRLVLNGPTQAGPGQTLSGSGAPEGPGVYVELWRVPPGSLRAESVASVEVAPGGLFFFDGIDVQEGEQYHVTLSRSWHFDTDGDLEGWDSVPSVDAAVQVYGGTLRITVRDGNGDGFRDPYFQGSFVHDASYYRVIEVRLRNPAAVAPSRLGVFWGIPGLSLSLHNAEIPGGMSDFETILIPMNVDEARILPEPSESGLDGLWTAEPLHEILRFDPLNGLPRGESSADGAVFEIDYIRIREDFRLDFHRDADFTGIGELNGLADHGVQNGFLSFTASAEPSLLFDLATGKLESAYFSRFVIGMDNPLVQNEPNAVGLAFNDDDSGGVYVDDGGNAQSAEMLMDLSGRRDAAMVVDLHTGPAGEWTEDGRVPVLGLETRVPLLAVSGDRIAIDYLGFVPDSPYGPSPPVDVAPANHPPEAVIVTIPDPPEVKLNGASVAVVLDASFSVDGDGGSQGLAYRWEVSGPEGASMDRPDQAVVTVTFTLVGEYVVELTVDDGQPGNSTTSALATVVVKEPVLLRGDVDGNGIAMEINDAALLADYIFYRDFGYGSEADLACPDSGDVDDDGILEIDDALAILDYHLRGPVPQAPFPLCGTDATPDALRGCDYPEEACAGVYSALDREAKRSVRMTALRIKKLYRALSKRERTGRRGRGRE